MPFALVRPIFAAIALLAAVPAVAEPAFPPLTGRVVDAANVIPPDVEQRIESKLAGLEAQSRRQLVVATIPGLNGYDIADYGYQLGRAWGIGSKERNDGALLIVAPAERKLRIEVGYGLEGVLTDGLSSLIINQTIVPAFKAGNMPAGIEAGTDALIRQLSLPEDQARLAAQRAEAAPEGDPMFNVVFAFIFFLVFALPLLRAVMFRRRKRYGPGGLGSVILWNTLDTLSNARGSSGGGFSGGGFSGGGGSFGGGGSSGSW